MTQPHKHYLKVAFTRAEIGKHVNFSKVKSKSPHLNFIVNAQIIVNQDTTIGKVQSLKIKETNRQQEYIFSQQNPKWDCIKLQEKNLTSRPQIKLNFSIQKTQKSTSTSSQNFLKLLVQNSVERQKTQVDFPIILPPLYVSLQQFLKQPYKLHVINLDFKIPKEFKFAQDVKQGRQKGERDGMVTFELSFLQDLRAGLQIRNIKLNTREFSKNYKIGVYQIFTNRIDFKNNRILQAQKQLRGQSYIQNQNPQKTIKHVYQSRIIQNGYMQFLLNAHGWEQFRNDQSFVQPHVIPLELLNEEDEVAILLEYQTVVEDVGKKIVEDVGKKIVEDVGMKIMEDVVMFFLNTNTNSGGKTHASYVTQNTIESLVKIDDMFRKINSPGLWTTFNISAINESHNFNIQFEYLINLSKGQYQQNLPKSLYRPTETNPFPTTNSNLQLQQTNAFEMITSIAKPIKYSQQSKQSSIKSPILQLLLQSIQNPQANHDDFQMIEKENAQDKQKQVTPISFQDCLTFDKSDTKTLNIKIP